MLPEVGEGLVDGIGGRLGDQDLTAVPGRGDAGTEVDVLADIALADAVGPARVQSHPHPDGPAVERSLCFSRSRDRAAGIGERDEERVPLCVDSTPACAANASRRTRRCSTSASGIPVTELVQEPRRALDVGEQERHRA
jgi:hypothetical protein